MRTEPSRAAAAAQKVRHEKPAAQERLANLQFTCPTTAHPIGYDVPSDAASVRDLWAQKLCLSCPHCGEVHRFAFRAAFLEAALAAGTLHEIVR